MAFPATPLALKTELLLNGTWTDVTSKTYQRDGYSISRGRQSEGSSATAATCTMTLNNRNGDFSPRNPIGIYYGSIGRNTRMRVSLPAASTYLNIPDTSIDRMTAPDSAGLSITGDIDLRVDMWSASWRAPFDIIGKYTEAGAQRSYALYANDSGTLTLAWSANGSTALVSTSTLPIPAPIFGRRAVRATLKVNNGSAGNTVTFYTAATMAGPWAQLGDAVVKAGTTSIFDSTAVAYVGGKTNVIASRVYSAQILSGIGGTLKASPDFTAQTDGATSFTDAQGNVWSLAGNASIVGRLYRYSGEVSEWPAKWDVSGTDVYVPVTASGIMRRLGTGSIPLKSAYYRGCTSTAASMTSLLAYWPCEDAAGSSLIASGLPHGQPMDIEGVPQLAADSKSFACSAPLPTMGTAYFLGNIPNYVSTGQIQVRILTAVPATGGTDNVVVLSVRCGGTAARWELNYRTSSGGNFDIHAYGPTGASLLNTSIGGLNVTGTAFRLGLHLQQSGSDVVWTVSVLGVGQTVGSFGTGTLTGNTITNGTSVAIAPNLDCAGITAGQITVQPTVTSIFELSNLLNAYSGETATTRVARLCSEEGIQSIVIGDSPSAASMGYQLQKTLLELLRECETADGGLLYEPREFFGIGYRSLQSLETQPAALTLNYAAGDLSPPFDPIEDDRLLAAYGNDVTASRAGGSSYRYTVATGPLSVQDPPNGIGTYPSQPSLSLSSDAMLPNAAAWLAHLGSSDFPRFAGMSMDLRRPNFTSSGSLTLAAETLDVGDRIVVQNPPAWMPPEDISQLVIGLQERLNAFEFELGAIGVPENPFRVAVFDDGVSRYSSDGTTTVGAAAAGVTTLNVYTPSGPIWGFRDGAYDTICAGERVTVTAVGSTQTLANPAFAANTTDWVAVAGATLLWDAATFHTASGSGKLVSGAAANPEMDSGVLGRTAVTPGEVVSSSAWVRTSTTRGISIGLNGYDSTGTLVWDSGASYTSITLNTWTNLSRTDVVAAGVASIVLYVVNQGTPGAGTILWVDDASMTTDRRQALTVIRAVNGIAKTIPDGSAMSLFSPVYYTR